VGAVARALEAGFDVHAYGHLHAVLHRDIPIVANTGFLIDGNVFHPGDSFTVPQDPVQTLLLPGAGPWLKTGEMIDYARAVSPERSTPMPTRRRRRPSPKTNGPRAPA